MPLPSLLIKAPSTIPGLPQSIFTVIQGEHTQRLTRRYLLPLIKKYSNVLYTSSGALSFLKDLHLFPIIFAPNFFLVSMCHFVRFEKTRHPLFFSLLNQAHDTRSYVILRTNFSLQEEASGTLRRCFVPGLGCACLMYCNCTFIGNTFLYFAYCAGWIPLTPMNTV